MANIYDMKLHEEMSIYTSDSTCRILRVAGGWIYTFHFKISTSKPGNYGNYPIISESITPVFVPFNNQFMEGNE